MVGFFFASDSLVEVSIALFCPNFLGAYTHYKTYKCFTFLNLVLSHRPLLSTVKVNKTLNQILFLKGHLHLRERQLLKIQHLSPI